MTHIFVRGLLASLFLFAPHWVGADDAAAHPRSYSHRHQNPKVPQVRPRRVHNPRLYFSLGGTVTWADDSEGMMASELGGGGGLSFTGGYRFFGHLALEFGWLTSFHGEASDGHTVLNAATMDARLFLIGKRRRMEPFLQLGVGAYFSDTPHLEVLSGPGIQAGVGVDIWLTYNLGVLVKALYRGAQLDNEASNFGFDDFRSTFVSALSVSVEAKLQF